MRYLLLLCSILIIAGCAGTQPLDASRAEVALTPREAAAEAVEDREVTWGGVIVNTSNLSDATRLEVLAYPLGRDQKPLTGKKAQGRFLAFYPGYLESADYAPGRAVTLTGTLQGVAQGKVGEANYTYPVLEAEEIELWPREPEAPSAKPRVNFGIGIILRN